MGAILEGLLANLSGHQSPADFIFLRLNLSPPPASKPAEYELAWALNRAVTPSTWNLVGGERVQESKPWLGLGQGAAGRGRACRRQAGSSAREGGSWISGATLA